MPSERSERIARNESRFRAINEGLRKDLHNLPAEPAVVPFVCECGVSSCSDIVNMSLSQYEAARADSRRFVVLPGHELLDTETVLDRNERYLLVQKLPDVGSYVEATDPRRQGRRPPA